MKKVFILLMMISLGTTVMADDYRFLTFETSDGSLSSIAIDNLRLTFSDGAVNAIAGEETLTLSLEDLAKMYFSEDRQEETAITEATARPRGVDVFSVDGTYMGRYANAQEAHQRMAKGIYVVKTESRTYKMTVR